MQEIILLAEILDEVVNPAIEGENLKRARGEETQKLKRLYQIFDIEIDRFKVKGKYHINKEYKECIKWLLAHSSAYGNRDVEIENHREISKDVIEQFRNWDFEKLEVKDLAKMVTYMVDGLMAFNTERLTDEQRGMLQEASQKIYVRTQLYQRQLEESIKSMLSNSKLIFDDKMMVYAYVGSILGEIENFTEKLVERIVDYRDGEEWERAFNAADAVGTELKLDDVYLQGELENIVFESSMEVLRTIVGDIQEEQNIDSMAEDKNNKQGEEEIDLGKWLEENGYLNQSKEKKPEIGVQEKEVKIDIEDEICIDDLELEIEILESIISKLIETSKRSHYTQKKKKELKDRINEYKKQQKTLKEQINKIKA